MRKRVKILFLNVGFELSFFFFVVHVGLGLMKERKSRMNCLYEKKKRKL